MIQKKDMIGYIDLYWEKKRVAAKWYESNKTVEYDDKENETKKNYDHKIFYVSFKFYCIYDL